MDSATRIVVKWSDPIPEEAMEDERRNESAPTSKRPAYEPPQIEHVFTPDELAREVHYAGVLTVSQPNAG